MSDPITGWDVLSDAVKIGLGSVTAWFIAKQSQNTELAKLAQEHKNTITKFEYERRTKMLLECLEAIDEYHQEQRLFIRYCKVMVEYGGKTACPPELRKETIECRNKVMKNLRSYSKAEAQLVLLGENECKIALDAYKALSTKILENYNYETKPDAFGNLEKDSEELDAAKNNFYVEMERSFKRVTN